MPRRKPQKKEAGRSMAAPVPAWARRYRPRKFPPFAYTADVVLIGYDVETAESTLPEEGLAALVVERLAEGPYQGYEAWPGGFVSWKTDATALDAAKREFRKKTGAVAPLFMETLDTYDQNGRDPRQFGGRRGSRNEPYGVRVVSKAHLALATQESVQSSMDGDAGEDAGKPRWRGVYEYLPWERGYPSKDGAISAATSALFRWAGRSEEKRSRVARAFGIGREWNEELAGERFRLLLEARLVEEAVRDMWGRSREKWVSSIEPFGGVPLAFDHRQMLADALGRLRSKIKYVPGALAALMPQEFTIGELRHMIVAVSGREVDKPNFWRMMMKTHGDLIRPTGRTGTSEYLGAAADPKLFVFAGGVKTLRLETSLQFPWKREAATNPEAIS